MSLRHIKCIHRTVNPKLRGRKNYGCHILRDGGWGGLAHFNAAENEDENGESGVMYGGAGSDG